ncbi:MAG: site-specific DNA-methyltransferase [Promethearchaeia archaeon]|nr:MAG: site-specific DNA-methyltransferase [Candidatus Lokiarchaeia archaeon]
MKTNHKLLFQEAQKLSQIQDESIELVITSPPYPMIEMWDEIFSKQNPDIRTALDNGNGNLAFKLMHKELNKVWEEVSRVLTQGGIACINIGDATRTVNKIFRLYPSHSEIINKFHELGFQSLPDIIWRKQTNAPNKFMGSGMYPPGAYVTLEHEYILIFRKGDKRLFKKQEQKVNRRKSAFFWEERNVWFSDVWDFKGISQNLNNKKSRERSAAFPFELAYRLINMYSVKGDVVLDPFVGTGTTTLAAIASERNSIGIDIDKNIKETIHSRLINSLDEINEYLRNRIDSHRKFINERIKMNGPTKYINEYFNFPIITKQELNLQIKKIESIKYVNNMEYVVEYSDYFKSL